MANKLYSEQFDFIRNDVRNLCDKITRRLANEASNGMVKTARKILDNFYDTYGPKNGEPYYYKRHYNLYNMINKDKILKGKGNSHIATVTTNPLLMYDVYRISPDFVYDMVWNAAHRGLPIAEQMNLDKKDPARFKGWTWHPEITVDELEGGGNISDITPHFLMVKYVDNWYKIGQKKLDSIERLIGKSVITFR